MPLLYDVKLIRRNVSSIIAGPFDTQEEAQMHATRYGLDFKKWVKDKYDELDEAVFADELDRAVAKRDLDKFAEDHATVYEVVPHKRGGI